LAVEPSARKGKLDVSPRGAARRNEGKIHGRRQHTGQSLLNFAAPKRVVGQTQPAALPREDEFALLPLPARRTAFLFCWRESLHRKSRHPQTWIVQLDVDLYGPIGE